MLRKVLLFRKGDLVRLPRQQGVFLFRWVTRHPEFPVFRVRLLKIDDRSGRLLGPVDLAVSGRSLWYWAGMSVPGAYPEDDVKKLEQNALLTGTL